MTGFWRGLTDASVTTDPRADDARLRGRTYAIPFDRVWTAALDVVREGMRRWTLEGADDRTGVAEVAARTLVFRAVDDLRIRIGLDVNGQTRVDLAWASRSGRPGLGRGRRAIDHFCTRLDRALAATPGQILDPSSAPSWTA